MHKLMIVSRIALAIAAAPGIASQALAQETLGCGPDADVRAHLERSRGEKPVWLGVSSDGPALLIVGNPDGTSWTLLRREEPDRLCPIASGVRWGAVPVSPAPAPGESR